MHTIKLFFARNNWDENLWLKIYEQSFTNKQSNDLLKGPNVQ